MDSTTRSSVTALAALLLACGQARAQDEGFHGGISVGALNTDNIFLAPAPFDEDETVFQVSPYLSWDYTNLRFTTSIRYRFDWYDYSDLGYSNEYHRYDANLSGELVDDTWFVDFGGARSQSVADPDEVIPHGGLPISGNLADRDEAYIGTRIEKTFGGSITLNTRYRYMDVRFDESDFEPSIFIQDNTNEDADFVIDNYRNESGMTWAARYEWKETDYDRALPWEYHRASLELGFWAKGNTRYFASGGQESAWDDPVDRGLQDPFWEVGFAYRNADRIDAEFAVGERSHGSSWRGWLDVSFRRGQLSLSYVETPTTAGFNRYSRGNLLNPLEPNDLLTRPGSAQRYISERAQVALNFEFRRSGLGISAFSELRTGRFLADGTPLSDADQSGINLSLYWEPGAKTRLSATGGFGTRDTQLTGKQDFISASFSAGYRIASRIMLSLGYNYNEQDPERGAGGRDYVANVTSIFLTYSF